VARVNGRISRIVPAARRPVSSGARYESRAAIRLAEADAYPLTIPSW